MGNGASELNITSMSLETHALSTSQIALRLRFLYPSHLFSPFFPFFSRALMTRLSTDTSFRRLAVRPFVSGVDSSCTLSQPSISPFSFFRL